MNTNLTKIVNENQYPILFNKSGGNFKEIVISLHSPYGDVITSYKPSQYEIALQLCASYFQENKNFTLTYKE
jgi:hypothetical protein